MDQYEKSIREKVHAAKILTDAEWVYLVGLFGMARDHADCDAPKLRAALVAIAHGEEVEAAVHAANTLNSSSTSVAAKEKT